MAVGDAGARRGEHVLGNDYPYRRFERREFAAELSAAFEVRELAGIRNIPARSLAQALRRLGAGQAGDRFQRYMTRHGLHADHFLERTAISRALGFFWLAQAVTRGRPIEAASFAEPAARPWTSAGQRPPHRAPG